MPADLQRPPKAIRPAALQHGWQPCATGSPATGWLRYSSGPRKVKEVLERLRVTGTDRALWPVLEVDGRIVWMRGVELEHDPKLTVLAEFVASGTCRLPDEASPAELNPENPSDHPGDSCATLQVDTIGSAPMVPSSLSQLLLPAEYNLDTAPRSGTRACLPMRYWGYCVDLPLYRALRRLRKVAFGQGLYARIDVGGRGGPSSSPRKGEVGELKR